MPDDTRPFAASPLRTHASGYGLHATTLDLGHASLEIVRVRPDVRVPPHAHESTHICYVFEGEMREREGDDTRPLSTGGLRLSPAGDRHEIHAGTRGFSCLVLAVADDAVASAGVRRPDARRWFGRGVLSDLAAGMLVELRRADDASPVSVDLLATELLATAADPVRARGGSAPPWFLRLRERLRDEPRRLPTLAEMAADAGVSRAHLAREFRRRTGRTIGAYVRRLRVDRARGLLMHTDLPLSRVAFEAGFADQSHMSRLVAKFLGLTPGGLRRRARPEVTPVQDTRTAAQST